MANVNSVSSNSYSSIYGSRNVLSGLASGMDTESMIENSVSGYKTKLEELQKDKTKLEWKQEAYQGITDQLVNMNQKYTSYTSSTNLYSSLFFSKSTISPDGDNASAVLAIGKSTSTVAINSVSSLATGARYAVNAGALGFQSNGNVVNGNTVFTGALPKDWKAEANLTSTMKELENESLTVEVDGVKKTINMGDLFTRRQSNENMITVDGKIFNLTGIASGEDENFDVLQQAFVDSLNKELKNAFGTVGSGSGATNRVSVGLDDKGDLAVSVAGKSGSSVSISSTEGLGFSKTARNTVPLDETLRNVLGTDAWDPDGYGDFEAQDLVINGVKVGSYTPDATMNQILKDINQSAAGVKASYSSLSGEFLFESTETGSGSRVEFEGLGKKLFAAENTLGNETMADVLGMDVFAGKSSNSVHLLNGEILTVDATDTREDLMDKINNLGFGTQIRFDSASGAYQFTGSAISEDMLLDFGNDDDKTLGEVFSATGATYEAGRDAEFSVNINGRNMTVTRATNTVDIDGMTVTLKKTFNQGVTLNGNQAAEGAVTFSSNSDTDEIMAGIKSFVEDYNKLVTALHDAYTTQPLEKNSKNHTKYEPLSESDKEDMSDSAIERYEEKAKTGLLFGDSDLSTLYNRLTSMVTSGTLATELRSIGITASYSTSNKVTTLEIDEATLKNALDSDPEKVGDIFSRVKDENGTTNGLMANVKDTLDQYASTSTVSPGVLVKKAGSQQSPMSLLSNDMLTRINNTETKISDWESKLNAKIDYYSRQFTALEKMMQTMNGQSSMLSGLMGG